MIYKVLSTILLYDVDTSGLPISFPIGRIESIHAKITIFPLSSGTMFLCISNEQLSKVKVLLSDGRVMDISRKSFEDNCVPIEREAYVNW